MRANIVLESGPQSLSEFLGRTGNLSIHLLNGCNLQCRHCYLDASPKGSHVLPLELVRRTIEEADALGIKSVQLSGGEPLLHPHIDAILSAAKGKRYTVSLSTNGRSLMIIWQTSSPESMPTSLRALTAPQHTTIQRLSLSYSSYTPFDSLFGLLDANLAAACDLTG